MDDRQALVIVSALANGTHPVTGEVFGADSPYQIPDVIRALFAAQRALAARSTQRLPTPLPESSSLQPSSQSQSSSQSSAQTVATSRTANGKGANIGKPWSGDEDQQLLAAFDADKPLVEIARLHGRTVNGVRARLEKHGRLEPSAATRWPKEGAHHGKQAHTA